MAFGIEMVGDRAFSSKKAIAIPNKKKPPTILLACGGLLRLNLLDVEVESGEKGDRACEVIV